MANGVGEILNKDQSEWRYFSVARNTVNAARKITSANFFLSANAATSFDISVSPLLNDVSFIPCFL